ncbi:MAG: antitoxin VbhA family protein [Oscillibacter sp.]|nr:antitoxin VbhA family protein [Oscillibacter sp.]
MAKKDYTVSMKNAEASVRMEGYTVTPKMRNPCNQVLSGKITAAERPKQFTAANGIQH